MRKKIISELIEFEKAIRDLPEFTHEDRKAAQSASQSAASLEESELKLVKIKTAELNAKNVDVNDPVAVSNLQREAGELAERAVGVIT